MAAAFRPHPELSTAVQPEAREWIVALFNRFEKPLARAHIHERALLYREIEDEVSESLHHLFVEGNVGAVADILEDIRDHLRSETDSSKVIVDSVLANTARFHLHPLIQGVRTDLIRLRAAEMQELSIA